MRINVEIDEQLLAEARSLGDHATNDATVHQALAEYVQVRKQRRILGLFGTVEFDPSYDYKAERKQR